MEKKQGRLACLGELRGSWHTVGAESVLGHVPLTPNPIRSRFKREEKINVKF